MSDGAERRAVSGTGNDSFSVCTTRTSSKSARESGAKRMRATACMPGAIIPESSPRYEISVTEKKRVVVGRMRTRRERAETLWSSSGIS